MTGFVVDFPYFLRLRREIEADHIGLILMSSAGYDPRVAVNVLEKLGHVKDDSASRNYCRSHPSSNKRSKSLSKASVMQEALAIYQDSIEG
nr:peptidase M48 [Tanacetum cinerariifolium]